MVKISTSVLYENNAKEVIKKLNNTNTDYIHIDIMDGNFVKSKSMSFSKIKSLLKDNKIPLDVHLMVNNPNHLIEQFALLNTSIITIHYELSKDINKYIDKIKSYGIKCGVSVKPKTPIKDIYDYLDKIDLVLVMSVEPGASGQTFILDSLEKISELKSEIMKKNVNISIEVDGGINEETGKLCKEQGADILVSTSYILRSNNYEDKINTLKNN